jgi:hypothetical protein
MAEDADLVAFLNARLAEDEEAARRATDGPWHQAGMSVRGRGRAYGTGKEDVILVIRHTWPQEAAHICRHDPARVLREVAAKRAILSSYTAAPDWVGREDVGHLAAVYSDHPDYREEWALT